MVVRTLLWIAGSRVSRLAFHEAMTEDQPITSTAELLSSIAWSVALLLLRTTAQHSWQYHTMSGRCTITGHPIMEGIPRRTSPENRPHPIACTQQRAPEDCGGP